MKGSNTILENYLREFFFGNKPKGSSPTKPTKSPFNKGYVPSSFEYDEASFRKVCKEINMVNLNMVKLFDSLKLKKYERAKNVSQSDNDFYIEKNREIRCLLLSTERKVVNGKYVWDDEDEDDPFSEMNFYMGKILKMLETKFRFVPLELEGTYNVLCKVNNNKEVIYAIGMDGDKYEDLFFDVTIYGNDLEQFDGEPAISYGIKMF